MFYSKVKNENNIKLHYYGKQFFERQDGHIRPNYFEPTDTIQLSWTTKLAIHNEVIIAKFDREVEGVRIYNIVDNFIQ